MNTNQKLLFLVVAGVAGYYLYNANGNPITAAQALGSDVTAAVSGWKNAGSGPTWVPVLNSVEQQYGFPPDMLASIAYTESSFIENVIRGVTPSSDGLSLGIMQLQTQFYSQVNTTVPFTDDDVNAQIIAAADALQTNFAALSSWPYAIAAYNAGLGTIENAGTITNPTYVAKVLANAPAANV